MPHKYELDPSDLKQVCDPSQFTFDSTDEISPMDEVIGQDRAVQAIDFGLNMRSPGYNIFVTGVEGTGKTTIVHQLISRQGEHLPTPSDWIMVNNFSDPYRPKAVSMPPGTAARFSRSMARTIDGLKSGLTRALEDEGFHRQVSEKKERFSSKKEELLNALSAIAEKKGLHMARTPQGLQTVPLLDGKPMTHEQFEVLPKEQSAQIEAAVKSVESEIESTLREINKINQAQEKEIETVTRETAVAVIRTRMGHLRDEYRDCKEILQYLDEVQDDIAENVDRFTHPAKEEEDDEPAGLDRSDSLFTPYLINILVERKPESGAPVIFEPNPTYYNVFGRIEKKATMGSWTTNFSMIQAGSLLQANGGFLILEIESVLTNPAVWQSLKRALQNDMLYIEDLAGVMGEPTASLKPEPIPLEVKVVLIGDYNTFELLQNYDSRFNKLFRVRADFDHETRRTPETIQQYARFVARVCHEEKLLPFTPGGVATVVEYAEKSIAHKNKLSLRFGAIVGLIKEADYWAKRASAERIDQTHVARAIREHHFRYNLYEEKIHESYVDNTVMIDVDRDVVGQVNALAVYQVGDISFGRPSRITAETYMGRHGIINIEREAALSGKSHDKGVMILAGYLGRTFARSYPLSVCISITFEQSYGGIDGDSASSTELYAILSSLSNVPIHQGIAVTGSVNQKGEIQAIGGVNDKIEGFYDVCAAKGITGRQGVIIPAANVNNLMVRQDVVDAVKAGRFHIYRVSTVREGIEILTGMPAGERDSAGNFPPDSVFGSVQQKLREYLDRSLKLKHLGDTGGLLPD